MNNSRIQWLAWIALPMVGAAPSNPAASSATTHVVVTITPYVSVNYDPVVGIAIPDGVLPSELRKLHPSVEVPIEVQTNTGLKLTIPRRIAMRSATDTGRSYSAKASFRWGRQSGQPNLATNSSFLVLPPGSRTVVATVSLDGSVGRLDSPGNYTGTLNVTVLPDGT